MFWLLKRLLKYFLFFISGVTLFIASLVVYLAWVQPPFYFPKPTGKYAVGVKTYHWIDTKRKETLHDDPAHPNRELMVNIWYPSTPKGFDGTSPAQRTLPNKPTTPYAPYLVNYYKKNQKTLWLLSGLSRPIYSYAEPGATLATGTKQFPIIIFSHGAGGIRDGNTTQCEELASQGYVVVGISHAYHSMVVQFPDGHIANGMEFMNEKIKKNKNSLKEDEAQITAIGVADVRFILDQLERLSNDEKSIFYQRLDQQHIGIFGHSCGGSMAIQACRHDTQIKAVANLEGQLSDSECTKHFDKPLMVIFSENFLQWVEQPWTQDMCKKFGMKSLEEANAFRSQFLPAFKQLAQSIDHDIYIFVLKDAGHGDLCDATLLKHASLIIQSLIKSGITGDLKLEVGSIDGYKATEIVNTYLVNFFNKYLKNQPSELLEGKGRCYAEVATKRWINKDREKYS